MKNNLEHGIKESLKEYEMPYDASAWDALSKKLDQTMPTTPNSNWKWYLGGAASVAIIVSTITLWPNDNSISETKKGSTKNEIINKTNDSKISSENTGNVNSELESNGTTSSTINGSENSTVQRNVNNISHSNGNETQVNSLGELINPLKNVVSANVNETNVSDEIINSPTFKKIKVDAIANVCSGEKVTIENTNNSNLILVDPNGTQTSIKADNTYNFNPTIEGKYNLGYLDKGELKMIQTFSVMPLPKADFITLDEQNKYEKGLPTVNLSATTSGTSYTWELEGQKGTLSGKDISVHYFNKGTYDANLTVQGSNGCKTSEVKTITVEDDYNLLAINAFDPFNSNNQRNSFMPLALTLRNVDFRLIIIDTDNGAVVYETTDATNPWTGIDKRNGQMVQANKSFAWKVVINNPEKGEKSEYKGFVIRL